MTVRQLVNALSRAKRMDKPVRIGGKDVTAMTENDECVSLVVADVAEAAGTNTPSVVDDQAPGV